MHNQEKEVMIINFYEHKECDGCFWQPYREIAERARAMHGYDNTDIYIVKQSVCDLCQKKPKINRYNSEFN